MPNASLEQLVDKFEELLKTIPNSQKSMFEDIGQAVLLQVQNNVAGTGKVKSWQDNYTGSKGGYAAIRPKARTYDISSCGKKRYAVGYITNAIENGHRQGNGFVKGKYFYWDALGEAEQLAYRAADKFLRELKERL